MLVANRNLGPYTVISLNAMMDRGRGVDRDMEVLADTAHRLDMVGMVMGDDDILYLRQRKTIIREVFLQRSYADTDINHQIVSVIIKKIAVTTATASERYKIEHCRFVFFEMQNYSKMARLQNLPTLFSSRSLIPPSPSLIHSTP